MILYTIMLLLLLLLYVICTTQSDRFRAHDIMYDFAHTHTHTHKYEIYYYYYYRRRRYVYILHIMYTVYTSTNTVFFVRREAY